MSKLLKVSRAVRGDDWFVERIRTACILGGVEYSEHLAMQVALACADDITLDDALGVDTTSVTDEAIIAALDRLSTEAP